MRNLLISLLKSFSITSRDQPRPILSRNPSYLNAHWIESKPFSFCRSKQWTWLILIRRSSRNSTEQTNPEKDNRHTQQIMNLATQLAVKELLKSKCLGQFINTSSNIWFKIFPLTLVVTERQPWSCYGAQNSISSRKTIHYLHSMSNTFPMSNLISFICPVVSYFSWSAVKYRLKTQKSQHFSFQILRTALSESRITSLKFEHLSNQRTKKDALIGARYIPSCGDLIGARYIH